MMLTLKQLDIEVVLLNESIMFLVWEQDLI